MDLIGGKWKSVILTHFIGDKKRYNELRREIPGITECTLSLQLKQLEADGMASRKIFTKKPPLKVEYKLTEFGQTLSPIIEQIIEWGLFATETKGEFLFEE